MKKLLNIVFSKTIVVGILIALQVYWLFLLFAALKEHAVWLESALGFLALVMFLAVIISEQNPAYKIGWIVLISAVPLLGGLLYLVMSNKKPSRRLRMKIKNAEINIQKQLKDIKYPEPQIEERMKSLSNYIAKNGNYPIHSGTKVDYFKVGEDMFASMMKDLKEAKEFIFFEYFIVGEGKMWQEMKSVLIEKAKQGVDVRVMYDDLGCVGVLPPRIQQELRENGVQVVAFNPLVPFLALVMNNRDHRKILVIDGDIGYNGGINIADEYININPPYGHWKDTGLRLEGEGVANLTTMFLSLWNAYYPESGTVEKYLPKKRVEDAVGYVQSFSDSPLDDELIAENVYMDILWQAKDYVYIFTPYLIIDHEMTVALTMAAKRGVDVRLVVPKIPDKKTVYHLTESYFKPLVEQGVKIYLYTPGFIHAKSYISDDRVAVVGTINMDYRSLYLHFECGTVLIEHPAIMDLKADCFETFAVSEQVEVARLNKGRLFNMYQAVLRVLSPLF